MLTDNKLERFTAVELIKMLSETDCLNCTNFDRSQFSKILRLNVYLQHQMVLLFEEDAASHLLIFVPLRVVVHLYPSIIQTRGSACVS